MNDAALSAELGTDPVGMGYAAAGWSASPPTGVQYQAIADLLNGKTRTKEVDVSGSQLFLAIKGADFMAVFDGSVESHKEYLRTLFRLATVPLKNAGVRAALGSIFSGKTATIIALTALQTVPISRVEELGGRIVRVGDLKRLKGDI